MLPSQYVALSPEEKAYIIAAIVIRYEADKKAQKEAQAKSK
jgi:hypothetical protein|nr:MAG TPA: hypothetical protein [Caudoviricetes sp.]